MKNAAAVDCIQCVRHVILPTVCASPPIMMLLNVPVAQVTSAAVQLYGSHRGHPAARRGHGHQCRCFGSSARVHCTMSVLPGKVCVFDVTHTTQLVAEAATDSMSCPPRTMLQLLTVLHSSSQHVSLFQSPLTAKLARSSHGMLLGMTWRHECCFVNTATDALPSSLQPLWAA